MKNKLFRLAEDLLWMMYPSLCAACGRPLFTGEECICTPCRYRLPKTGFHTHAENPVIKHFWGKVRIQRATAYYYFSKGQRVQELIHQLKYKGRKDVGDTVGKLMGNDLKKSDFNAVDLIVPVPLHKSRQKVRGYNQCDCIGEGLSAGLNKKFSPHVLERREATQTQTNKSRYDRYRNVENIFTVAEPEMVRGKNILLIDDVITTGSTLISCAEAILNVPDTEVFIAAIACA